jgi:putative transposase
MGRGLERRWIFNTDEDKTDFLARLGETLACTGSQCLAWSLMSHYYHHRHRRSGYVFQNRYKSILCDADAYLLELVRYVHLNPLRADLVKNLGGLNLYPWSGHATLMGHRKQDWQSVTEVLSLFAKRAGTARRRYREFIAQGLGERDLDALLGRGLVRSYGGWKGLKRSRKKHAR